MESNHRTAVTLHVDPSCPFAWITSRWLAEVEAAGRAAVTYALVSLSVINDGRDIEDWYRDFNDRAWGPSRVAAAVEERHGAEGLRAFYEAFGTLHHVEGRRHEIAEALRQAGLEPGLAAAAEDSDWDERLRKLTELALAPVHEDVGTPVIHVGDAGFFGPVLSAIPRGDAAVELFDATITLARHPEFLEFKRGRPEELSTS